MKTLNLKTFFIAALAGVLGTYVMTVTGVWQAGLGLLPIEPSGLMQVSLNAGHGDAAPYGIVAGHVYHYLNGIALAVIFASVLKPILPGHWAVHGVVLATVTTIMAAAVIAPLSLGVAPFFIGMEDGLLLLFSDWTAHLGYAGGVVFTLAMLGQYAPQPAKASQTDVAGEPVRSL